VVKRVLFFRPTLGEGGADRVTITLLQHLDRSRFAPMLVLARRAGVLRDEVPSDVPVSELGVPRLAVAAPFLARAIHKIAPDVVVCTAGGANAICVAAHQLARSRSRLVLSERSSLRRSRSALRAFLEMHLKRVAYRRADLVAAVSEGVASDLVELLGLAPERVHVVYNPMIGDDIARLAAEAVTHPWFADARPLALAVGRLVAVKDHATMFEALAIMRQRVPVRLVVLGEGPLRTELLECARSLGLSDVVAFLGYDKNPYRYMSRAHVLLQSSRAEGLPGVLIQSLACGTPVVATDCDHGPREVVEPGRDGFLVPVGDAAALAERALAVLEDAALRSRLRASGAARADRFTVRASMARYHEAIGGAP
jgi:glycosyltransferase involved in cell wall biosynthesis